MYAKMSGKGESAREAHRSLASWSCRATLSRVDATSLHARCQSSSRCASCTRRRAAAGSTAERVKLRWAAESCSCCSASGSGSGSGAAAVSLSSRAAWASIAAESACAWLVTPEPLCMPLRRHRAPSACDHGPLPSVSLGGVGVHRRRRADERHRRPTRPTGRPPNATCKPLGSSGVVRFNHRVDGWPRARGGWEER